nr:hypothetical protein [Tanacetum cinerariifolium]
MAGFLKISNLFQYGENQEEAVMLRTVPFSLSGEAKTWLNELNEGTITLWNEIREAFISRYFSPTKFKLQIFNHDLDDPTQGILDARGIFLYNTPNEAFKILEDKENVTEPFPTLPNPQPINSNSPTVSPFLKECTVHIPYMNAKMFTDVVLPNHVGNKELKSNVGFGTRRMTKKMIEKNDMGLPNEPNKEWKLNEKVVSHNKEVYQYL